MNLKKRIAIALCTAVLAVSFASPFPGGISCAENTEERSEEDESAKEKAEEAKEDSGAAQEEKKEDKEAEKSTEKIKAVEADQTEKQNLQKEVKKEASETDEDITDKENADNKEKAPPETETGRGNGQETGTEKEPAVAEETETETEKEPAVAEETETETEKEPAVAEETGNTDPEEDGRDMPQETEDAGEQEWDRVGESEEGAQPADIPEDTEGPETVRTFVIGRAGASTGISPTDPQIGQENSYGCTNGVQVWTAPAGGKYRIACHGGAGGAQEIPGDTIAAGKGSILQGTIRLEKGTMLYLHVGGDGAGGSRQSHGGEGGNDSSYNGGAGAGYDTADLGNHGRYWTHGAGGGASDVRLGGNGTDNQIMVAGGGGGANKQNAGRNADGGSYNGRRLNGSYEGGGGGYYGGNANQGGSSYVNTAFFTDIAQSNGASAGGQITIRVVALFPKIRLSAPSEWTNEDITVRAEVLREGEGAVEENLSWEKSEEGEDIWTGNDTYRVSQNGTYICKVRDREGNTTEESFTVRNIDRLPPLIQETEISEAGWTRGPLTLTVHAEDAEATAEYGCSGLEETAYLWGRRLPSGETVWERVRQEEDGAENTEDKESTGDMENPEDPERPSDPVWTEKNTFIIYENGTYLCRVRDRAGNVEDAICEVRNIDRTAPRLTYRRTEKWYEGSTQILLEANDLQPDLTPGCGLAEQAFSRDGIRFDNSRMLRIEKEGSYYIWIKDLLGNIGKERIVMMHDARESGKKKKTEPEAIPPLLLTEPEETLPEEPGEEAVYTTPPESAGLPTAEEAGDERHEGHENIPISVSLPDTTEETTREPGEVRKRLPVMQEQPKEQDATDRMERKEPVRKGINWKKAVLYSVWTAAVLCGLLWLLFCLLFEHVTVYRKDEKGNYKKAGRCAIVRKKDYKQINLLHLMKKGEMCDYKVRFSGLFTLFHKKEKVMVRTLYGVELHHIKKEIEISYCNSGDHMLT